MTPPTRRQMLASCALLPLAACSAMDASCGAERLGSLPMRLERGALLVPVALGQRLVLMILDTGAERTILDPVETERFGYREDPARVSRLVGVGGRMPPRHDVTVPQLTFGDLRFNNLAVAVGETPLFGRGAPVVGLIGGDILGPLDLDFDFAAGRLALYHVPSCSTDPIPWSASASRLQTIRHGRLTVIEVELDGTPLTAVIDTGATRSVLLADAADRIGLRSEYMLSIPSSSGEGIGGLPMGLHAHRFRELRMGQTVFRNQVLAVGEGRMGNLDMLIGLDLLRLRRMWISPSGGAVYFRTT
jgi:predicted aspartyl protease